MKYSLGISNFLEEISSLSYFIVFLYFFVVIKTIPKKKKCKKAKWLSEDALQIAQKRREAKGKGEKINQFECRVSKNSKER